MLEHFQRDDLNRRAARAMAVLRPLKLVIDNYPDGQGGVCRGREQPRRSFRRNAPGALLARALHRAGRLPRSASAQVLPALARARKCVCATPILSPHKSVVKDAAGNVVEVHCTYDPASRGGNSPDGRKVKSTMHWVSARARHRSRNPPLRQALLEARSLRLSPRAATSSTISTPTRSRS